MFPNIRHLFISQILKISDIKNSKNCRSIMLGASRFFLGKKILEGNSLF
jgi:hypothetical protein